MKKLIVANWKLNPETPREARELSAPIRRVAAKLKKVTTVICPPAVYLQGLSSGRLLFGAQDCFGEISGAFTGKLGPTMLYHGGARYLILGHSETRARLSGGQVAGDTDLMINHKVRLALKNKLKVILCVGEHERDHHGEYLKIIKAQLEADLKNIQRKQFDNLIIAYEPLWAIGASAKAADTPEAFHHQSLFIRKVISRLVGKEQAMKTPVLYGGSVNSKNAAGFLTEGEADGLLVGHASLNPFEFIKILKIADDQT